MLQHLSPISVRIRNHTLLLPAAAGVGDRINIGGALSQTWHFYGRRCLAKSRISLAKEAVQSAVEPKVLAKSLQVFARCCAYPSRCFTRTLIDCPHARDRRTPLAVPHLLANIQQPLSYDAAIIGSRSSSAAATLVAICSIGRKRMLM